MTEGGRYHGRAGAVALHGIFPRHSEGSEESVSLVFSEKPGEGRADSSACGLRMTEGGRYHGRAGAVAPRAIFPRHSEGSEESVSLVFSEKPGEGRADSSACGLRMTERGRYHGRAGVVAPRGIFPRHSERSEESVSLVFSEKPGEGRADSSACGLRMTERGRYHGRAGAVAPRAKETPSSGESNGAIRVFLREGPFMFAPAGPGGPGRCPAGGPSGRPAPSPG